MEKEQPPKTPLQRVEEEIEDVKDELRRVKAALRRKNTNIDDDDVAKGMHVDV